MNNISRQDYESLSKGMEIFHGIFAQMWRMGRPTLNEGIPTARVIFDHDGGCIDYQFNPSYWHSLSEIRRKFVICHESLHVMFDHGGRMTEEMILNDKLANVAMDIAINEGLVEQFGFKRDDVDPENKLCWIDTVFPEPDKIERRRCFEYYFEMLKKDAKKVGVAALTKGELVDDHSGLDSFGDKEFDKILDEAGESLSGDELKSLDNKLGEIDGNPDSEGEDEGEGDKKGGGDKGDKKDGDSKGKKPAGGRGTMADKIKARVLKIKVKPKPKWETIIKKWARKFIKMVGTDREQWAVLNRRLNLLPRDMFLPSEYEVEDRDEEKKRIQVYFFLDVSGSCSHLTERFYKAAKSLPKERFEVIMHCFDTSVYPVDISKNEVQGHGCGTYFSILETYVQKKVNELGRHPDACFVITDGYGDHVKHKQPKRWFWFIESLNHSMWGSRTEPKDANIYDLKDFE